MTDIAAIAGRHRKGTRTVGIAFSTFRPGALDALRDVEVCDDESGEYIVDWPCDASILAAANADLRRLLADAVHDLIEDWETTGGPRLDYAAARAALEGEGDD